MVYLLVLAGFGILYIFLRTPQWIANKTGKTVIVKSTFSTSVFEPQNKWKRELEILNYPMMMSMYHEVEYINTGNIKILEEYKKLSIGEREKIEYALPKYLIISAENITQELQIWHLNNFKMFLSLTSLDFLQFYTLSNQQKQNIKKFKNEYLRVDKLLASNQANLFPS